MEDVDDIEHLQAIGHTFNTTIDEDAISGVVYENVSFVLACLLLFFCILGT